MITWVRIPFAPVHPFALVFVFPRSGAMGAAPLRRGARALLAECRRCRLLAVHHLCRAALEPLRIRGLPLPHAGVAHRRCGRKHRAAGAQALVAVRAVRRVCVRAVTAARRAHPDTEFVPSLRRHCAASLTRRLELRLRSRCGVPRIGRLPSRCPECPADPAIALALPGCPAVQAIALALPGVCCGSGGCPRLNATAQLRP